MNEPKLLETEVMTCEGCIYSDADTIRCNLPAHAADCHDEKGRNFIYVLDDTEEK